MSATKQLMNQLKEPQVPGLTSKEWALLGFQKLRKVQPIFNNGKLIGYTLCR